MEFLKEVIKSVMVSVLASIIVYCSLYPFFLLINKVGLLNEAFEIEEIED